MSPPIEKTHEKLCDTLSACAGVIESRTPFRVTQRRVDLEIIPKGE